MRASPHDLASPIAWGALGVTNAQTLAARCNGGCRAGDAYSVAPGHLAIDVGTAELLDFAQSTTASGDPS